MAKLDGRQVIAAGLTDWRRLNEGLHARFATGDLRTGARFVQAVAEAADEAGHHPDVTLRFPHVDLKLVTHAAGNAVTERDVAMARRISGIARDQGLSAEPSALTTVEIALDTADRGRIGPFWSAVLTGWADGFTGDEVADPAGRSPILWFQPTEAHDEPRQRFHLDVWVPDDVVEDRVRAAVAAGGTEVMRTPTFVVLADADGNKACVCFSAERD